MQIKVKTLVGDLHPLEVQPHHTIEKTKHRFSRIIKLPKSRQCLVHKGKIVKHGTLKENNIVDGDFVVLIPRTEDPPNFLLDSHRDLMEKDRKKKKEKKVSPSTKSVVQEETEPTSPIPMQMEPKSPVIPAPKPSESNQISSQLQEIMSTLGKAPSSRILQVQKEDTSESEEPQLPPMNEGALQQLLDMGFPEGRSKKALYLSRMNTNLAMEWLLEHDGDPNADEPLSEDQIKQIAKPQTGFIFADPAVATQRLKDMGFTDEEVSNALHMTGDNYASAAAWLLGDRDSMSDEDVGFSFDESNPVVSSILASPQVQNALDNPRVLQALKSVIEDPSTAHDYLNDPEVGPVLLQVRNIIQEKEDEMDEEGEEEADDVEELEFEDDLEEEGEEGELDEDEEDMISLE